MDRKSQRQNGLEADCRNHLASIVSQGLDPIPPCVFDLDVLLRASAVDVTRIDKALSCDAEFSLRVLRLSNAMLNRSDESAASVTDAVVLLGPCLFYTAVLLCGVTEFGAPAFRDQNAEALWPHSLQMAILSEKIAERSEYPLPGAAYVAGLLHDIGNLPLLMVAREQENSFEGLDAIEWRDNIELERSIFGLDHCQIGRWMAKSWRLSPSLVDAVGHHHNPARAEKDSHLAEIVGAAEYFCGASFPLQPMPLHPLAH